MIILLTSVVRCVILYIAVVFAVRIMGKRQIGELQPSELVITFLLSELAALPLQDIDIPLLWGVVPMFLVVALELLMSTLTLKSMKLRKLFYGNPILLIYNGKVNQHELLRTRVSMEDIMEAIRGHGLVRIEDVQFSVLETNGTVSVIPKPQAAPPSAKDMNVKTDAIGGIPKIIVMNGRTVPENMVLIEMNQEELDQILDGYNVTKQEVFMLTVDDERKTYLIKNEKNCS